MDRYFSYIFNNSNRTAPLPPRRLDAKSYGRPGSGAKTNSSRPPSRSVNLSQLQSGATNRNKASFPSLQTHHLLKKKITPSYLKILYYI